MGNARFSEDFKRDAVHQITVRGYPAYKTREDARRDVSDYIEMFYRPKPKHARNGMLSPVEFERQKKWSNMVSRKLGAIHVEACQHVAVIVVDER